MNKQARLLMCPPDYYDVEYVINPWMEGNVHRASHERALDQWRALVRAIEPLATVELASPQRGLPDMVFTANAGLAIGRRVVLSRFLHCERQGEEKHFRAWFAQHGFETCELPHDLPFEGAGDALLDPHRGLLWAGYGQRTELADGHARCTLIRDLVLGEQVVVGVRGIRTLRKAEARDKRGVETTEFGFMGAGVSSERRVELVVEEIAWQLWRIRERGGKVVVVPGPVVIHTGAGEHLAWLVRNGFVQALLGGNAIAVHDLEQALLGTSLGVDLRRGVAVRGGHRHHLRTINTIRGCGSIAAAVEQGVVTSGVFYECIKAGVPFSLAGSIRDDGPLPDTEMDLIRAQQSYARLVRGADMVLMLSTMLHSIGVGNMTPAGVNLVCVDINPAVVTKLADRGSLESVGVVTDVGLFLSLLVQRLAHLERGSGAP